MMTPLCILAEKYHCDKLSAHSYIPMYDAIFRSLPIQVHTLLEIGIGYPDMMRHWAGPEYETGASLRMWAEFLPKAMIYGIDNHPACMFDDHIRIHTILADQTKTEDMVSALAWMALPLDIIIDDGSHVHGDQLFTAKFLMPHLSWGGAYIIEDVWKPDELAEALRGKAYKFGKQGDDNLVVIRKGW